MQAVRPVIFLALGTLGWALALTQGFAVDYVRDIKPLLANQCVLCHGESQQKGGLRLDTGAAALRGGESGPAFVAGKPDGSLLIQLISGTHAEFERMPYKRPPLESPQIELVRNWIEEGAQFPSDELPSSDRHWAFEPPQRPNLPSPSLRFPNARNVTQTQSLHPVDAFILDRLEGENLTPSPEADRTTLIRRLYLDLIGLPPTQTEISAFINDSRPNAYEHVVDGLLQSPHYGERWGRWWLDGARYADSNGYSIDGGRPIWPYRDWVVRAFNEGLPFDTFTQYQIAGDLLAQTSQPLAGSVDADRWIASGFHRNTQINHEGGIDPEEFRIECAIDRVNTTATVWLGLTLACAQCHDHKFDPLSQRDYFQFFAFFNSSENDGHGGGIGPVMEIPTEEDKARLAEWQNSLRELEAKIKAAEATSPDKEALDKELQALRRKRPTPVRTMVMRELKEPRDTVIFIQGDFTRPGKPVEAALPSIFTKTKNKPSATSATTESAATATDASLVAPSGPRQTRVDLATWLTARDNPLTARVMANRVWQQFFGRGIVETDNDFGTMGSPPSHPELLDWLAVEFMESGWLWKPLHRLIVTSQTYRQSSTARSDLTNRDARNLWLARQNRLRLDAEIIRDVALTASGLLDRRIGGPPVHPPQPEGLSAFTQSRHAWPIAKDGDRHRRGLYTYLQRSTLYPSLAVFDAPDTFSTCTRRLRSNTPLQALTLLNDQAFFECAQALATRMREPESAASTTTVPADRFKSAFEWCVAREPDTEEVAALASLFQHELQAKNEDAAWLAVARVLLNLDETITRE